MDDPQHGATLEERIERCRKLEAENHQLRAHFARMGISPLLQDSQTQSAAPHNAKPPKSSLNTAQKIVLFRSLFRGREDVYARRWESPDGRSGYSPKTERERLLLTLDLFVGEDA